MIGLLDVGCTSTVKPHACRRFCRNPTWSSMPSPVRLTEAMRTESRRVRTSAGAASSSARSAMGPCGGLVTGLAESMEYILTPAVIVYFIGTYFTAIFETPEAWQPLWWAAGYAIFLALNLLGVELSFRISVI